MRISDWSSDVCSSDLLDPEIADAILESVHMHARGGFAAARTERQRVGIGDADRQHRAQKHQAAEKHSSRCNFVHDLSTLAGYSATCERSEEHTSELPSLMRTSYSVFRLKKTTRQT